LAGKLGEKKIPQPRCQGKNYLRTTKRRTAAPGGAEDMRPMPIGKPPMVVSIQSRVGAPNQRLSVCRTGSGGDGVELMDGSYMAAFAVEPKW